MSDIAKSMEKEIIILNNPNADSLKETQAEQGRKIKWTHNTKTIEEEFEEFYKRYHPEEIYILKNKLFENCRVDRQTGSEDINNKKLGTNQRRIQDIFEKILTGVKSK